MLTKHITPVNIAIIALTIIYLLLCLPGNAGAQTPTPTPDGMTCITPTPDGPQWCMVPPVAVTVTPSATVAPPTSEVTPAGELTPFEPTATATMQPTPTNTRRPRPTFELTPVRVGSNAHLPIIFR